LLLRSGVFVRFRAPLPASLGCLYGPCITLENDYWEIQRVCAKLLLQIPTLMVNGQNANENWFNFLVTGTL
jgi:hypothetical protein